MSRPGPNRTDAPAPQVKIEFSPAPDVVAFLESHAVDPGSVADAYVLCMYFVCTVLTTTGFGDVTAASFPERVFMILLMAMASLLFGLVLGEAQVPPGRRSMPRRKKRNK